MEAKLFNQSGEEVGTIQITDYIFGIEPNVPVPIKDGTRLQFGRVAMTFHE